jgi:uncharacterized protein with HEPN domain
LIPWKKVAGMRDVVIHDYLSVDWNIVWDTVSKDLPRLRKQIEEMIVEEG